jgi:hypothetical protein
VGSVYDIQAAHSCYPSEHGGEPEEKSVGSDGANLIMDGIEIGLGQPVLARAERGVELHRRQ